MRFEEYRRQDATGLAELVARGEVRPAELLELAVERARTVDPTVHPLSVWDLEHAERQIDDGLPGGPFRGVPFLLKDLHAFLVGTRVTNGSRLTRDFVPEVTGTFVERILQAGLVLFGKTNAPEFGLNVVTEPVLHGPTRNPWNLAHSPGGSSGGAAAAVASGVVPMAQASDGGGSIRIPASHCGLVGLKPSRARIPTGPAVVEAWSGLATGGVLSRSVRDTARFLDAVHGPETGDFYACPPPSEGFEACLERPPGKLRVGVLREPPLGLLVEDPILSTLENTMRLLEGMGHALEETRLPLDGERLADAFLAVVEVHTANELDFWARRLGRPADADHVERCTLALAELGRKQTAQGFVAALQHVQHTARVFGRLFERFDLLLSPVCAAPPPRLGEIDQNAPDLGRFLERNAPYVCFTSLYNASGCPAISLPLGKAPGGLPIGIMLGAPLGAEERLLSLAAEIERAVPWSERLCDCEDGRL